MMTPDKYRKRMVWALLGIVLVALPVCVPMTSKTRHCPPSISSATPAAATAPPTQWPRTGRYSAFTGARTAAP